MDVFMDTRHCPYCGEEIEANARKCKYCDEWLEEPTKQEVVEEPPRIIPCPVCGEEIGEDTEVCPHCHERVGKARAIPVVHAEERRDEEGEIRREKKVDSIENQPERMEDSSPDAGNGRKESFFQYYFVDAFIRHYVDFKGKTSRKQYWLGFVCYLLTMLLLGCLDMMMRIPFIFITLGSLALTLPCIAIVVRRLHDVGKSGWWIFIYCIPLAGPIWLLVLLLQKGETKAKPVKYSIYDTIVWLVLVFALAGAYYINEKMDILIPRETQVQNNDLQSGEKVDELKRIATYSNGIHQYQYALKEDGNGTLKNVIYQIVTDTGERYQFNLESFSCGNNDVMISSIDDYVVKDEKIIIIGNYDAASMFSGKYVVFFDMSDESLNYVDFGQSAEFVNNKTQIKVTKITGIKGGSCIADNEYEYEDTFYSL